MNPLDDMTRERFHALLQTRYGLYFATNRLTELEEGIVRAMQTAGFRTPADYYNQLVVTPIEDILWKNLVSELTIGETYFFRNQWHFQALRERILPPLIEHRRKTAHRMLRLWSAGCSTGEEAYSLAMLLCELIPDIDKWLIYILGTDINYDSLKLARKARYRAWSFRTETPGNVREKYFTDDGTYYELKPEIRRMVQFHYLNLVDDNYPSLANNTTSMDIVFCRNVTIYFDKKTTREIVQRFQASLLEGGWLFVGHSEPLTDIYRGFKTYNFTHAIVYQKPISPSSTQEAARLKLEAELKKQASSAAASAQTSGQPGLGQPQPVLNQKNPVHVDLNLDEVYEMMKKGAFDNAREVLKTHLKAMPQHIDALFLLAKLSADEGQTSNVHEILDTIDELNPLIPQAHYLRALLFQQSQAWDKAKVALRRALYADRKFALAHYYMGELLYIEGNISMARRSWQNAFDLLSNSEADSEVPYGDGTTVGTLLIAIEQRLSKLSLSR